MPHISRPDGTRIYYEVRGHGFPVLLLAPGGISSQVSFWPLSPVNPFDYSDEFMIIGMNQRHAESSPAPLQAATWSDYAADQLAVLDALDVTRALLWGGCIGVGFCLKLIQLAPERVAGAICQDAVGIAEGVNSRETFYAMFKPTVDMAHESGMQGVVRAALTNPSFAFNNAAGPFGPRIASDEVFRRQLLKLTPTEYEAIIRQYDDNIWGGAFPFMSVPEEFIPGITTPLLILPGDDPFHPKAISDRLCAEAVHTNCLGVEWRSPDHVPATKRSIADFMREHAV